jgi:hypothetical protein
LKTREGKYCHDNLDIHEPFKKWSYVLDEQTIPINTLESLGVGACDKMGNVSVTVWHVIENKVKARSF